MQPKVLFCLCLSIFAGLIACQNTSEPENNLQLHFRLSPDSTAVLVQNLPPEMLSELQADSLDTTFCKQFMAVYPEPDEEDLRDLQRPLAGTYQLRGSELSFKPQIPFIKGRAYFALAYPRNMQLNALGLIQKNGWRNKTKPLEYKFRY